MTMISTFVTISTFLLASGCVPSNVVDEGDCPDTQEMADACYAAGEGQNLAAEFKWGNTIEGSSDCAVDVDGNLIMVSVAGSWSCNVAGGTTCSGSCALSPQT